MFDNLTFNSLLPPSVLGKYRETKSTPVILRWALTSINKYINKYFILLGRFLFSLSGTHLNFEFRYSHLICMDFLKWAASYLVHSMYPTVETSVQMLPNFVREQRVRS